MSAWIPRKKSISAISIGRDSCIPWKNCTLTTTISTATPRESSFPQSLRLAVQCGYIQLGTSHDTGEFACDSFRLWWTTYGRHLYPTATAILVLCDGGGSNSTRHHLFKQDLQALADELGIEIRIATIALLFQIQPHRTPPLSACHPSLSGVIFTSIALVKS